MGKISERCKNYLKWASFTLRRDKPRYSKALWIDAIVALVYSGVSIFLIWKQKADVIVLGLNILCVIRAIISNKLSAYEITGSRNIEDRFRKYNHYHDEAICMCVAAFFSIIVWFVLVLEYVKVMPSSETGIWLTRIITTIAILIVLGNDWEDLIVYAYDATIV